MKRRIVLLLLMASFWSLGQQKRKQESANRIEVLELKAQRDRGQITLDGAIKNTGTRPLSKVVLMFDLLDADRKTLSSRRGPVDQTVLEPGEEWPFNFYVSDHARAIEVRVAAEQRELVLDVAKPGPYPID